VIVYLLLALFLSTLSAEELSLPADEAHYAGDALEIQGHVQIECALGTLLACKATLTPLYPQDACTLSLEGDVVCSLQSGDSFTCERATIALDQKSARFYGESAPATYVHAASEPWTCHSPYIVATFKGRNELVELEALKGVEIIAGDLMTATADRALYEPARLPSSIERLTLFPGALTPLCHLKEGHANWIDAALIEIDITQQTARLHQANGLLHDSKESEPLQFRALNLHINRPQASLTLVEDAFLQSSGIGALYSDRIMTLFCNRQTHECEKLVAEGKIHLDSYSGWQAEPCSIDCIGSSYWDRHDSLLKLSSSNPNTQPLCYTDRMGQVRASNATLDYIEKEGRIKPHRLTMQGDVALDNRAPLNPFDTTAVHRRLLADRLEYQIDTQEMVLSSVQKQRVLYYDLLNGRQLSADKLRVTRDGTTKKECLRGDGRVRMLFSEEELQNFKNTFAMP
jgi:hypothetical protein